MAESRVYRTIEFTFIPAKRALKYTSVADATLSFQSGVLFF